MSPRSPSENRSRSLSPGFTLVEVLVAATIATLLTLVVYGVVSSSLGISDALGERAGLQADAQRATLFLRTDVNASRVLAASGDTLRLVNATGDTIRYRRSGGVGSSLDRQVGSDTARVVADRLLSVSFTPLTATRERFVETLVPYPRSMVAVEFRESAWDDWASSHACLGQSQPTRHLTETAWLAEEFWTTESYQSFIQAWLRVGSPMQSPPSSDLVMEIYRADAAWPYYPDVLLYEARLDRFTVPGGYDWRGVPLDVVTAGTIPAGAHCWIIFRADSPGYAGSVEYEALGTCAGGWPDNGMVLRLSDDGGASWDAATDAREAPFRVDGLKTDLVLEASVVTTTDTTGVEYMLSLEEGGEVEQRAGHAPCRDL